MNRLILIVGIVLCGYSLNAQNQNNSYQTLIHKVDSLKTVVMSGETVQTRDYQWHFIDLSVEERNRILDYIETFYTQTEYMGLYNLGISLLVRFFHNLNDYQSDDKYTMDRIARLHLEKAFYVFRESFSFLGRVEDYSDATRERLRNILEGNKTERDIEARRRLAIRNVIEHSGQERIDSEVERMMQITDRNDEETRIFLTDSITNLRIESDIEFMNRFLPFGVHGILRIGSSNDLRFVAGLERILETDFPPPSPLTSISSWERRINNIREAAIYALAKLGVQKYLDIVFAKEYIYFEYLGTRDAFFRWLEMNRDWNRFGAIRTGASGAPMPLLSLWIAQRHILNEVPREVILSIWDLERFCIPDRQDCDCAQIEYNKLIVERIDRLHQWFLDNKDSIELPPATDELRRRYLIR